MSDHSRHESQEGPNRPRPQRDDLISAEQIYLAHGMTRDDVRRQYPLATEYLDKEGNPYWKAEDFGDDLDKE